MVDAVAEHSAHAVERIDPQRGSMMSAVWLRESDGPGVLMLVAHVLALDPASWRIVLGELDASWHTITSGLDPLATTEHTSYRRWSRMLAERAARLDTCDFWAAQLEGADPVLGTRRLRPEIDRIGDVVVTMSLTEPEVSARVLSGAVPAQKILAAAAARTIDRWREHRVRTRRRPARTGDARPRGRNHGRHRHFRHSGSAHRHLSAADECARRDRRGAGRRYRLRAAALPASGYRGAAAGTPSRRCC